MKKLFLALATTMIVGSVATVFATELNNTTKSGTTEVNYSLLNRYTITIPEAFNLSEEPGNPVQKELSASDVFIDNNTKLQVVVEGENCNETQWFIKDVTDATNAFEYKVNSGDFVDGTSIKTGDVVLEVLAGDTNGGSSKLNFDLVNTVVKAGTYKDTLTFTSSIVSQ